MMIAGDTASAGQSTANVTVPPARTALRKVVASHVVSVAVAPALPGMATTAAATNAIADAITRGRRTLRDRRAAERAIVIPNVERTPPREGQRSLMPPDPSGGIQRGWDFEAVSA